MVYASEYHRAQKRRITQAVRLYGQTFEHSFGEVQGIAFDGKRKARTYCPDFFDAVPFIHLRYCRAPSAPQWRV